jgi:hypothetical protein
MSIVRWLGQPSGSAQPPDEPILRWYAVAGLGAVRPHLFDGLLYPSWGEKVTACGLRVPIGTTGEPYRGDPVRDEGLCPRCRRAIEWAAR